MIYTITLNPAVDYVVHIDDIRAGQVNRAVGEEFYFGGKGINVSLVLNELGVRSRALGFAAGFTGRAIEDEIAKHGVETDFVHLEKGFSRINVKIRSGVISDSTTELNGRGPEISDNELEKLFEKLRGINDGDMIVLAGSVPKSLPGNIYELILKAISDRNINAVIDAEGDLLLNTLKYRPFLVKPNKHELGELFGVQLHTIEETEQYAKRLKEMGARNVLVSLGEDGALLVDENGKTRFCGACKGEVRNTVGAGDAMVAGFIAGFISDMTNGYDYALKLGTAAGGATAFSDGLAKRDEIYGLVEQLNK